MAIASRLTNTGTLLVNGSFDEVTNAGNTSFATRTDSTGTVYTTNSATGFDEVSYSASGGTGQLGINGINTGNNIVSYSQQFNQTSKWGTGTVTVAINVTPAPENSLTGTKLTEDSVANTRHVITQNIPVTAGALSSTYSASVFAKAGERGNIAIGLKEYTGFTNQATAFFNLSTGTVGSLTASNGASVPTGNITPVGNNWYRCAMSTNLGNATATAIGMEISTANSSSNNTYTGDGTSGLYIWGAQTQQAAAATVYVATGPTANVNLNNFARRDVTTGVEFVYDNFDEVTWNPPIVSSGLLYNLDASVPGSYSGTGTTWIDLTGNGGNSGSTTNFPFSTTGVNSSFFFNGISTLSLSNPSGYITSYADAFSAEVWLYIPSSSTWDTTGSGGVYSRGSFAGSHGLIVGTTNNTVGIFVRGQTLGFGTSRFATITRDAWYHIVGTWSGSGTAVLSIYSNGVLAGTTSGVTNTDDPPDTGVWRLGGSSTTGFSGAYPLAGVPMSIATARLYNTSLSAADVKQNYNALCYRYGLATI